MGNVTGGTKIPCRVRRTLNVGDFSILHQLRIWPRTISLPSLNHGLNG
jgi:hypothetical protein